MNIKVQTLGWSAVGAIFGILVSIIIGINLYNGNGLRHVFSHDEASQEPGGRGLVKRDCDARQTSAVVLECFYFYTHGNDEASDGRRRGFRLPLVLLHPAIKQQKSTKIFDGKQAIQNGPHINSVDAQNTFAETSAHIPDDRLGRIKNTNLVIRIAGGPGAGYQTIASEVEYWQSWLQDKNAAFDLLLYDPRAVGHSFPSPKCSAYDKRSDQLLAKNVSVQEESTILFPVLEKCLKEFSKQLSLYLPRGPQDAILSLSSLQQASDINNISQALGYNNVALWAVSYGTRVALLAARYPQIKLLLLDSPYPFSQGRQSDWPNLYEHDFELHAKLYPSYATEQYSSYRQLFSEVSDYLEKNPVNARVKNWSTGTQSSFVLTADRLVDINLDVLYDLSQLHSYYAGLQYLAETGKINDEFQDVLNGFISNVLDDQFNYFVYFMVECLDNPMGTLEDYNSAVEHTSLAKHYFMNLWPGIICHSPLFVQHKTIEHEAYFDVPTLIFSGEYDPVTPKDWGGELYSMLTSLKSSTKHHQWVVVPNAGHAVLDMDRCGGELPEMLAGDLSVIPQNNIQCTFSIDRQ